MVLRTTSLTRRGSQALRRAVVEMHRPGRGRIIWGSAGPRHQRALRAEERVAHVEVNGRRIRPNRSRSRATTIWRSFRRRSICETLLELRDAHLPLAGELVFAYGIPRRQPRASDGRSSRRRQGQANGDPRFIAADIRLAPGNSGSSVVDAEEARRRQQYDRGRVGRCDPCGRRARVRDTRHHRARGVIIHSG